MSQELSIRQQNAWLSLAADKNQIVEKLKTGELALQGILLNVPDESIDSTLKTYRGQFAALCDARRAFTTMITDKLIDPLMEYEKRADPKTNPEYKALEQKSLEIRLRKEAEIKRNAGVIAEKKEFEAFVRNAYEDQCMEYRRGMYREIQAVGAIADLSLVPVPPLPKFNPKFLSVDEMKEIFSAINKPDYAKIMDEMEREKDRKPEKIDEIIHKKEAEVADNKAVNIKIAAATAIAETKTTVKRKLSLTADADNWPKIVSNFATGNYLQYVKVKDIGKLTVQQMATAMADDATATGLTVAGLFYNEVLK